MKQVIEVVIDLIPKISKVGLGHLCIIFIVLANLRQVILIRMGQ